jgi:hypothetical protein
VQALAEWLKNMSLRELIEAKFLDEWTWQGAVKAGMVLQKVSNDTVIHA